MSLTPAQIAQYRNEGFLVLNDFVTSSSCDRLRERAAELVNGFNPGDLVSIFSTRDQNRRTDAYFLASANDIHFFFEEDAFLPDGTLRRPREQSLNKIGHALHDLDPVFDRFSRAPAIKELVADLEINDPLLLQSMYIFKQPLIGGEVTCHQDTTFLFTDPDHLLGLWFALEDATIENGCLWAIPGGHLLGLKSRWLRNDAGGMRFEVYDQSAFPEASLVPLEVSKGSVVLLHGLMPHKSLANRSSKSRHAYTLHVISAHSRYPESNWLQRSSALPLRGF
jgi:phytanoyl-CoA hydroxylase